MRQKIVLLTKLLSILFNNAGFFGGKLRTGSPIGIINEISEHLKQLKN